MPDNLYYTQHVRGFQQQKVEKMRNSLTYYLKRTKHRCPCCGSTHIAADAVNERQVRGEPMGACRQVFLHFTTHRLYCHNCHNRNMEHIPFLSHPKSRLTKALERTIIELRQHMSIRAIANFYKIRWHTIKELGKQYLQKKYARIQTAHVRSIGLDEIYVSRQNSKPKYLTVIRDLESGAVLFVGDGKGVSDLEGSRKILKKSNLRLVAMDMSNAYSSWFRDHFPDVKIVFDHFHVIKLMNEKLDTVRRWVVSKLDEMQRSQFKGLRFIFLQNHEDLCEDAKAVLQNIRTHIKKLADAYMLKESLRSIYNSYHTDNAFHRWCRLEEKTQISELKTMAKTIRNNLDGIKTYWRFRHQTNAKIEGFNNKIRWLIRQAYGFRDREYFKLKIFQLPEISCVKEL